MRRNKRRAVVIAGLLLLFSCMTHTYGFAEEKETADIDFTETELAFIQQSKAEPITVGIIPNLFPMSTYDPKSGEFSGIIIEMLERVENHTGLVFEYYPIELERETPIVSLKAKDTRLVAGILRTQNFMDDKEIVISDGLFDGSIVFAGRKGENFMENGKNKTIAILNGFQVAIEHVEKNFPEYKILFCPTTEACLDAVARGDADATLHNKYGLNYLLQNPRYANLEMIQAFSLSLSHCIAGRAEDGGVLIDIVNKGLGAINDDEYNYVLMNYTIGNAYEMTISDTIYKYRMPIVIIAVLLLIIFSGIISIIMILQKNTAKLKIAYGQTKEALATAQHASDAKSQFTSRMSHEIRTPLNAVIGYIAIAKDNITNRKKVYDCITKSELAAKHLLSVINDVLDMSSIESGKIKIANSEFDLKQLISNTTAIFYSQAKQREITIEVSLKNITEEKLIGDGLRLNQILMNLLSNAVKFTPKGGNIRFTAEQLIAQKGNVYFRFSVADTGIGITEGFMEGLFVAYAQEDASIAQNYGGSGLGLAITKNLVTMMGGTIRAESKKGEGTVFTVELPFGIDPNKMPEEAGKHDFSNLRVLIADEDKGACEYMKGLFVRCGVHTDIVPSGAQMMEKLMWASQNDEAYDLCLVDLKLPDMTVVEAIKKIRAIGLENTPIIIPITYDYSEVPDEVAELGVQQIVAKPLFQSTMFDLLMDIYGKITPNPAKALSACGFDGKRLLLAEDNEMNLEIATEILEAAGFVVESVKNGKLALERFISCEAGYYDAILMDVQMPEMNGYEATMAIRASANDEAKSIPIIAMTANAFAEDVVAALASGMNDHIAKPIDMEQLYLVLRKYMGGGDCR